METHKKNSLKIILAITLAVIVVILMIYFLFVFLPQHHKQKQQEVQAALLQGCLNQSAEDYTANWSTNCVASGQSKNCTTLSTTLANYVENLQTQENDACFKQYPQN